MNGAAAARAIAAMRRRRGQTVTLQRLVRSAPPIEVTLIATVKEYRPDELTGGIQQGDRWAKAGNDEIAAAGWPGPPRHGDRLIVDGRTYTVQTCSTATMGDAILSHTMWVQGAA